VRKPRASAQVLSSVVENLEITEGKSSLLASELLRPGDQLRQSIEAFLLDQRSENTRRAYGKDLKRFLKFLVYKGAQSHAPDTINRSLLIAFKEHLLSEKLEHVTVDRHLASLRSFFRWLVDDGLIKVNPAAGVRFLNPKRISKTNGFSDEEVVKILGLQPLHSRTGAMHHAILCLLFYCGLRRSELCGLRTTSLGVERSHPVLRLQGKGNKERMIPLVPPVQKAISHYLKITGKSPDRDAYLFSPIRNNRTSEKDKPLDPSMIFYLVTKYAKQAGVKNRVSPHSCRATAISNARDHQVSDRAIQEFAGWSSPDMITRYDKRKTSILQSAAHVIDYLPKK
jgi:site-specific recombinase XerD